MGTYIFINEKREADIRDAYTKQRWKEYYDCVAKENYRKRETPNEGTARDCNLEYVDILAVPLCSTRCNWKSYLLNKYFGIKRK